MTTASLKSTLRRRSLVVAAAFTLLGVTTMSVAAPASDASSGVKVRYGDLNLATAKGVDDLYRRIARAAREVCPDPYSRDLDVVAASQRCQAESIARAVAEVNNPQLALVHAEHTPHG